MSVADAEPEVQDGVRVCRRTYAPYVGRPEMAALARGRDLTELDITQLAYGEMASALCEEARAMFGPTVPPDSIRYRVQFELIKDFGDGPTVSFDAVTALANEAVLPPRRKGLFGTEPTPAAPRLVVAGKALGVLRDDLHARFRAEYEKITGERLKTTHVILAAITVEASVEGLAPAPL